MATPPLPHPAPPPNLPEHPVSAPDSQRLDSQTSVAIPTPPTTMEMSLAIPLHESILPIPDSAPTTSSSIDDPLPSSSSISESTLAIQLAPASISLPLSPSTPIPQSALPTSLVTRFRDLLKICTTLINTHGPYRCSKNRNFKRAKDPPSKPLRGIEVQYSLAYAQDALPYPQAPGPANDDLQIFASLWSTTLQLLRLILANNTLSLYCRGHGVYGLSAGFNHPYPTAISIAEFGARRARLHQALIQLPSLEAEHVKEERERIALSGAERVGELARTNKEVHDDSMFLVQIMRGDRWGSGDWGGLRWFHGIVVVDAWLGHLQME